MNLYEVLGLKPDAGVAQIRAAYRKLSAIHHPDKEGGNEEKFREIKDAYDVLIDQGRRARYDKTGRTDADPVTPEAIRNVMEGMIIGVINHEREDGSTDDPVWDDIKHKIILSIRASRREVMANIKNGEKKLRRAKTLAARFKPKQEADPVGDIFRDRIAAIENQLQSFKDALELSVATEKAFSEYEYEVGPGPEGQNDPGPTLRLSGVRFLG